MEHTSTDRRLFAAILLPVLALVVGLSTARTDGQAVAVRPQTPAERPLALPNRPDSLKFGVLGDFGTGGREQYRLAEEMARVRTRFPYELVITVGDNIYGSERPQDFVKKFEAPYKALLDGGVKFFASLGNHDSRNQRYYKLFNMEGRLYYSFKAPKQDVRFFALESSYMDREQLEWLDKELDGSGEKWKIPYFHHPLYSSGGRHGSEVDLRRIVEPLFIKHNVSVVFTGHDHVYERVQPQNGIIYFVTGSGGKLRRGNVDPRTGLSAKVFDTDQAFLVAEIDGDQLFFNAVSREGTIVDSGVIERRQPPGS